MVLFPCACLAVSGNGDQVAVTGIGDLVNHFVTGISQSATTFHLSLPIRSGQRCHLRRRGAWQARPAQADWVEK